MISGRRVDWIVPLRRPHAIRIAIALVVLALAAAAIVVARNARHDQALAEGRRLLLEGDFAGASARLEPVKDSSRVGRQARAGLAVARAAADEPGSAAPLDAMQAKEAIAESGVELRPLLDGAMRARRYGAALALGRLAADGGDASGFLYQAAAQLESGRDADARALVAAHPEAFPAAGPGHDIALVLALREQGAGAIVRDAAGRLLGIARAAGFQAVEGVRPEWVPPLALRAVPEGAAGARLTIDLALTRLAAEALAGRRGSVVLVDPQTGAVRVAMSDAATFAAGGTPAFEQQREPASIQKLVTAAAALRAGLDPDAEIRQITCTGSKRYGSDTLWCSYPGGQLHGLGHALAISCNIAFADLGTKMGRVKVVEELKRFGFDADAPGSGHIREPQGDERQLADLSIGLEATEITPAHAARMAAIFAEGSLPGVFLVAAEDGATGMSPQPKTPPPARRVLESAWVPVLRAAMAGVTGPGGTAEGTAPLNFPVAMKTGTAATPGLGYHVNYIGVGPASDPKIAFCLRVTNQGSSRTVNESAREALRVLLAGLGAAIAPR
jgi:hypothetical protein